jgi:isoleucyl-tRNA synthetase
MLEEFGGSDRLSEWLAEFCITSGLTIKEGVPVGQDVRDQKARYVEFALAEGEKCQRCWKILPDVGTHKHPHTCARCNTALG